MKLTSDVSRNNQGFSLLELVVSILIMGVLSGIIVILISVSRRTYSTVNTETVIQTETEAVRNFIGEIALEAKEYGYVTEMDPTDASYPDTCVWFLGPDNTAAGYSSEYYYHFILCEKDGDSYVLRYGKFPKLVPGTDTVNPDLLNDENVLFGENYSFKNLLASIKGDKYSFLAEHIKSMSCSDPESDDGLITITLSVGYNDVLYDSTFVYAGRNR